MGLEDLKKRKMNASEALGGGREWGGHQVEGKASVFINSFVYSLFIVQQSLCVSETGL